MVRAYRVQIAARTFRDGRYRAAELGNRPPGILLPGPGQPHRFGAVRRSVFHLGAQGHSGGCLALGLHPFRARLHEVRYAPVEPPRRVRLPGSRRLLYFPEITNFKPYEIQPFEINRRYCGVFGRGGYQPFLRRIHDRRFGPAC